MSKDAKTTKEKQQEVKDMTSIFDENSSLEKKIMLEKAISALDSYKRGAIPPKKLVGYQLFKMVSYMYAFEEFKKLVDPNKDPCFDSVKVIEQENKNFLVYYMKVAENSEKEAYVMISYYKSEDTEEYIDEFFRTYLEIPKSKKISCRPDFFQLGDITYIDTNDGIYEFNWMYARNEFVEKYI